MQLANAFVERSRVVVEARDRAQQLHHRVGSALGKQHDQQPEIREIGAHLLHPRPFPGTRGTQAFGVPVGRSPRDRFGLTGALELLSHVRSNRLEQHIATLAR